MNIGFDELQAVRLGCVSLAVKADNEVVGTATNVLTPNRTFRLVVTNEWAIDEYTLQDGFDFNAVTVADVQAAIRTLVADRLELRDSYGNLADFPHHP